MRPFLLLTVLAAACTPQARAPIERDVQTALTAEQTACLVAEHYGTPTTEADALVTCQVSQVVGGAFLAGLRIADGTWRGAGDAGVDQ